MLYGIVSDVHANALALDACLAALARLGCARLVFLGDIVGYGPEPEEVASRVSALAAAGALCLMGNHDAAATGARIAMNDTAAAAIAWTRTRLSDASRGFLSRLPMEAEVDDMLFVHAEASKPAAWLYVIGPGDAMRSMIASPQRVTFCGHVHRPQLYCLTATAKVIAHTPVTDVPVTLAPQRQWLAVAGAAGQPRDGNPAAAFLTYDSGSRDLVFRRVPYDHEAAAERVRAVGLPERLAARLLAGS